MLTFSITVEIINIFECPWAHFEGKPIMFIISRTSFPESRFLPRYFLAPRFLPPQPQKGSQQFDILTFHPPEKIATHFSSASNPTSAIPRDLKSETR